MFPKSYYLFGIMLGTIAYRFAIEGHNNNNYLHLATYLQSLPSIVRANIDIYLVNVLSTAIPHN